MNVLFLSQIVPYPPHGGVLQRGYNLLRELSRSASVHLLAFVHPDVLPTAAALDESRRALGSLCETVRYFPLWAKGSRFHRLAALAAGACSRRPFSVVAHRSAAFRTRADEILRSVPFDVIHLDTLALAQFVRGDRQVPAALTHHNIESELMRRRSEVEPRLLARAYLRRETAKLAAYESLAAARCDVNILVSAHDEATLRGRVHGLCTTVVPNGVDIEYFTPDPTQETRSLIYTGGMNMFANRDGVMFFLTEVWPLIRDRSPDTVFHAVGQDPPDELQSLARLDPRIVVHGFVPDIRPLVRGAGVYVVPLRVGGGTRLKVLDAMAMGKALVSTSIGCEGLDVSHGEHLLVADTPQAIAEATLTLLGDRERRLALGRAARERVERRYAWGVVGRQLVDAYRLAMSAGRRSG